MLPFRRRNTPEVGADELAELLHGRTIRLLDVREDWEFRRGHVPGAIHLPLSQLAARVANLPRDKRILVICQSGSRSLAATDFLLSQGFQGAASVRGGTSAWVHSGGRLEVGPSAVA